jgi:hypothetical protein
MHTQLQQHTSACMPAHLHLFTCSIFEVLLDHVMRACAPAGIYVHGPASCSSCQAAIHARLGSRSNAAAAAGGAGRDTGSSTDEQAASCNHSSSSCEAAATAAPSNLQQQQQDSAAAAVTGHSSKLLTENHHQQQQPHHIGPKQRHFAPQTRLQQGVLRTNCIDCLDRTNVVQFAYGLTAFGRQLAALGVLGEEKGGVDSDSSIAFQLMEMYEGMGHTIALQVRLF